MAPSQTKVAVVYYALLRDQAGQDREEVGTARTTVRGLYRDLQQRHGFTLPEERLQVAVNDAFCSWDAGISDGDEVVFIPPVAGGSA